MFTIILLFASGLTQPFGEFKTIQECEKVKKEQIEYLKTLGAKEAYCDRKHDVRRT